MLTPNNTLLFQGDSITDTGRHRDVDQPNNANGLGTGYCNHIAANLLLDRPADNLQIYNRGISGNRIVDLYARWKIDAINLQPDVISILIGVNDTWHEFGSQNGVEVDRYETVYRMLLDLTKERLPSTKLILCEPFVMQCGVVTDAWIADMQQRQQVVKKLANEYGATFVPFQSALDDALNHAAPDYWAHDGVHPTIAGHQLLANCWIESVM